MSPGNDKLMKLERFVKVVLVASIRDLFIDWFWRFCTDSVENPGGAKARWEKGESLRVCCRVVIDFANSGTGLSGNIK